MVNIRYCYRSAWCLVAAIIVHVLAPMSAKADLVPGCESGYDFGGGSRTITFTPNIQTFLDYDASWTEATVRRDITAALEEWNAKGQANVRLALSNGSTNLAGYKNDSLITTGRVGAVEAQEPMRRRRATPGTARQVWVNVLHQVRTTPISILGNDGTT